MARCGPMRSLYPENSCGGFTRNDGTVAFFVRVNALITRESTVLDVGCGRGESSADTVAARRRLRELRGKCAHVVGIDVDPAAASDPLVDEFRLGDGPGWSVAHQSMDLCLVDNVLEHVVDLDSFLRQCHRVLAPGGKLCVRTPNARGYAAVLATIVPGAAYALGVAWTHVLPATLQDTLLAFATRV